MFSTEQSTDPWIKRAIDVFAFIPDAEQQLHYIKQYSTNRKVSFLPLPILSSPLENTTFWSNLQSLYEALSPADLIPVGGGHHGNAEFDQ